MKTIIFCNASATIDYLPAGYPARPRDVKVTFTNHNNGTAETKVYKTLPAAKAAVTRYFNRIARVYA